MKKLNKFLAIIFLLLSIASKILYEVKFWMFDFKYLFFMISGIVSFVLFLYFYIRYKFYDKEDYNGREENPKL